jgi:benzylsuccinate CoA-transferase BbsF subunit
MTTAGQNDDLPPKSTALSHIRICDLSGMLAGAGATKFLAAFGAQVIRVEDPVKQGRWDIIRGGSPNVDERRGINLGGAFNNHNVEKLGVTLNLRTERGKTTFLKLVATSDAVTENFAAGVMDRLGLGYDRMTEVRPDLVYVSNSGFGSSGPYKRYKTFGPIVQALSGLTFTSALPGREPAGWGYSYMDHMGGNFMALAVLAGLVNRNRSGRGQWIDMSCTDAGVGLAGPELLEHTVNGKPARMPGEIDSNSVEFPAMVPHGVFPAVSEDSWVAIACRDDGDWKRLAEAVGEDWMADTELSYLDGRVARRVWIQERLAEWTAQRDNGAIEAVLRSAGVPVARVASPPERVDQDPATSRWGLWPVARHTEMGDVRVDGIPLHLSETDWSIARGSPCLGEHNRYVYREIMGFSDADIDAMADAGDI